MRTPRSLARPIVLWALATPLLFTACASELRINSRQAATISPQALDTLKTLRLYRFPFLKASDKMIWKMRGQFAELERGQLAEMQARFQPAIESTLIGKVMVVIVTPRDIPPQLKDKIALYIHGGGYVMGSATDRTGMLMTNEMKLKTYSVDYRLAPEAKFPVALEECLEVYKHLVAEYGAGNIVGFSTSAGSGHMLAMLLKAQELGLPMISSIGLLSPSVDLSPIGDALTANEGRDLMTYDNSADKFFIAPFVGKADIKDPLLSPIYGTYRPGFPATTIVTGTRDVFLSGSARLYWKLRDAGIPSELLVSEGMWHAFTNYPDLPEAIQSRGAVQAYLLSRLGLNASNPDSSRNVNLVKRFIAEVVNGGRIDEVDKLWAKDLVWRGGSMGEIRGLDEYKKFLKANVGGAFTGMRLEIHDIVAHGDRVVLRFTNSGRNSGSFMGMPATGKDAKWLGIGIYRIESGKIAEAWFAEDMLGMYRQLGYTRF